MEDILKSGIGGEETDQSYVVDVASKPIWRLTPLPLNPFRPSTQPEFLLRGPVQSLHSLCLASISRNFHLFSPSAFTGVSPLLVRRVLSRVRADRRYEDLRGSERNYRPDEATIWAFSALLDPEGAERSHILGLPIASTLAHLPHNALWKDPDHPLISLPVLYRSLQPTSLTLLTTLTLDGMDSRVSDTSIQTIKWCPHLTALWMKGCKVSDIGIRLLASALELPGDGSFGQEGRGMWRLRAWFLRGCTGVSDRSMRAFVRWPGLVVLDVRDTSCTDASMGIFNRYSRSLFSSANPDFQPCTPGLLPLFATKAPPSEILNNLCLTLLAISRPLALHIIPSSRCIPPEHLPDPTPEPRSLTRYLNDYNRPKTVYRAGGIGQIYGHNVTQVHDEVRAKRTDVRVALMMQAKEEESLRIASGKQKKKEEPCWDNKMSPPVMGKVYKEKTKKGTADERSKTFVSGGVRMEEEVEVVTGRRELMMVRMLGEGWERLSWASGAAVTIPKPDSVDAGSRLSVSTQRTSRVDLVGAIMAATTSAPIPSGPFRPMTKAAQSSSLSPLRTRTSQNPFRQSSSQSVRPPIPSAVDSDSDDLSFSSSVGRKRTFDGAAASGGVRRGWKMFSGARA